MPKKQAKKTNPKKSHPYIQVRLKPGEKEEWIDFVEKSKEFNYLSELVRYCVREYIEKGEQKQANNNLKPIVMNMMQLLTEERKEYMEKINQVLEESRKSEKVKIERKHKDQVLKLLEKHRYTSEDIADIYGLPEKYVIDVLNDLLGQGIIKLVRHNKKLVYEVIDHEYNG